MTGIDPARRGRSEGGAGESGQSTIEFVLLLPVVFVVLLGLVQVGVAVHSKVGVAHTAREVARTLAVEPTADPHAAAVAAGALDPDRLEVTVSFERPSGIDRRLVVVEVRYRVPLVTRIADAMGDLVVSARAAMLVES